MCDKCVWEISGYLQSIFAKGYAAHLPPTERKQAIIEYGLHLLATMTCTHKADTQKNS